MRDFCRNAFSDVLQEGPGEFDGSGDHEVICFDGAEGDGIVVGADAVHDADGLEAGHDGEVLRDEVRKAVLDDRIAEDGVGFAEDMELFARNTAQTTDRESRTGERLTVDER